MQSSTSLRSTLRSSRKRQPAYRRMQHNMRQCMLDTTLLRGHAQMPTAWAAIWTLSLYKHGSGSCRV